MIKANEARNLSREWRKSDQRQLTKCEKKIKRACKKGDMRLVLTSSLRPRVFEKLKQDEYKVTLGLIGAVIEWENT